MRNLLRSVLRKKPHSDGDKLVKKTLKPPVPTVVIASCRPICNLKDLECRFGSAGELYEQVAKCANELRDGRAKIESGLNNTLRAWRRSADSSIFIYSVISVGTSTAAVVASAVGFIPVYRQLAHGAQLAAQILCIPAAERRHRIARQRLDTGDQGLKDLECFRGVQFALKLVQRGRDSVVDVVLGVLLELAQENQIVDAKRAKAEVDTLIKDSSTNSPLKGPLRRIRGIRVTNVDGFYQLLRR
ncbi:hypothetical protein PHYSODRAFT_300858 [Phytophthora sojae]|uniref:Uncharacterized protein n=1 Tax=Phytophthora sojae (strain P6497) TaxID=1094619 RepID=G4ZGA3_PHYSP|nr:hypothetical protein PHYSODRAFT_300858 [Phytophthora sojae]EGZ18006.1 hypothetical protein PHYSODRAFT_300858 [Phytophthora sojae]|eukprot:XP_009527064.1 hypothetical protein PHYSODRAFT_300858 [Phytophthora sojae]